MSKTPLIASISSGKGGVGKTFITVNLAACLARKRKKVLVVDCDLGLSNIDIMLGINPKLTLKDVIFGDVNVDDVLITTKGGFDFVPASSGAKEMAQLLYENIETIKNAIANIAEGYDYVLLDIGAGISETVLQFNLFASRNIIVLNRELTSLTDAYAMIKVIYQMFGLNSFDIIVNSARDEEEGKKIFNHIDAICGKFLGFPLHFLGHIVYDDSVQHSIMKQQLLMQVSPGSIPARNCVRIADVMTRWKAS